MNMQGSTGFVVETSGLTKRFGDRVAVDNVELRVPRGSAFGYLGPNGAGKTTLIRMLLGLTSATAGSMKLRGLDVPERRNEALARVGAIVEEPRFHGHLTGRENLRVVAAARGPEAFIRIESDGGDSVRVALRDANAVADLNRRLVQAGISVRRLDPAQASLEQRFLEVTTRLEDAA